ncbi:hypothetical protein SBRCBS47491_003463 [Sporothrix bragantina]|uniref:Cupin 2 conserved barrel domain-containing protein n=1 Tax=Sporothrix bragantina TaxID=671064 RepID=A0ABP0BGP3_9PEZI
MAALLPILQEILPMLMPGSVHITKAEELQGPPRDAVVDDDGVEEDDHDVVDDGEAAADGDDEDEPWAEGEGEADMTKADDDKTTKKAEAEPSRGVDDSNEKGDNMKGDDEIILMRDIDSKDSTTTLPLRPSPHDQTQRSVQQERPSRPRPQARARKIPNNGVSLRDAIVHKSGSLCASVLTIKPQCSTVVFHNGEQEAIVYAVSGTATFATLPEDFDEYGDEHEDDAADGASTTSRQRKGPEPARTTISAGDFVFIPAWTEHQVRNEGVPTEVDGVTKPADDVVWVVVRNAGEPTIVPLQGWGGEQAE